MEIPAKADICYHTNRTLDLYIKAVQRIDSTERLYPVINFGDVTIFPSKKQVSDLYTALGFLLREMGEL